CASYGYDGYWSFDVW
nr:immunoglobulin heavy chain junction region [Mus musculus]